MPNIPEKKSRKRVLIVDYGMGNAGSVKNALDALSVENFLSSDPKDLAKASHIILPGVGAFDQCMKNLKKLGFVTALKKAVVGEGKPFLGICLGMQILAELGEEGGKTKGLGWIKGVTRRFTVDPKKYRLPHVGWNDVEVLGRSELFKGINHPIFYFVHSFHFAPADKKMIIGASEYGERFAAAVESKNIFGVQFHPEKSQHEGLKLIENFLTK
ncbi:MAG TPA: imidazole glycerol phosphate synthase subunit HisH [Candidatus Paceibacterota bacterium]